MTSWGDLCPEAGSETVTVAGEAGHGSEAKPPSDPSPVTAGSQDGDRQVSEADVLRAAYAGLITRQERRRMPTQRPRPRYTRPRVVEPKLPITDGLTERDFGRLERAAQRQLERNRRRLNGA